MSEPWVEFDGVRNRVTASAGGVPIGWMLDGCVHVTRSIDASCLDQELTFSQESDCSTHDEPACERSAAPDAVVILDRRHTAIGGGIRRPNDERQLWLRDHTADRAAPLNGSTLYSLECPGRPGMFASALVSLLRRATRGPSGQEQQTVVKRIRIRHACPTVDWLHLAVNIRVC
jgi:hypothetical protein